MTETEVTGYAYQDDEEAIGSGGGSSMKFGLNAGVCFLKDFKYITNGGTNGAEGEALEVIFEINGQDKSARKFPVTKAFGKNNTEIIDPKAPEIQQAKKDLGAWITHIMHCFVSKETLMTGLSVPIAGFKDYCNILVGLLPQGYNKIPLDIFAQWQWQVGGENEKTYLELPKNMKQGRWLAKAVEPVKADGSPSSWKEFKIENPDDTNTKALYYMDEKGNTHPFVRTGWFMNSNYAHQQKLDDAPGANTLGANTPPPVTGSGTW